MALKRCLLLAAVLFCIAPHSASAQELWGYIAHWTGDSWRQHDLKRYQRLFFFDLEVGADGTLNKRNGWPDRWQALRSEALRQSVPLDPTITLLGKERFIEIFSDSSRIERLLNEIDLLANSEGVQGIHLDIEIFEPVAPTLLNALQRFVDTLRTRINPLNGKFLSAFVPTAVELYSPESLRQFDALVVQGYDAHWQSGPNSGPVALLDGESRIAWAKIAKYLKESRIDPARVVFSTPAFGYEWPTKTELAGAETRGNGRIITLAPIPSGVVDDLRISALGRIATEQGLRSFRDRASNVPWYAFEAADGWWQGWYDDPAALLPRLQMIQREGFRGIALFPIGYDGGLIEDAVVRTFQSQGQP